MTQKASIPVTIDDVEGALQCRHYWVIQPASGPVSQGVCQNCSEIREFKNYVEGAAWGDSRLSKRANAEEGSVAVSRVVADQLDNEEED